MHDYHKINCLINTNFEKICHILDIDVRHNKNMYQGCCPVHEGDNPSAFGYKQKDNYDYGTWCCFTHQCEQEFGKTPLGFLKGVLSKQDITEEEEVLQWLYSTFDINIANVVNDDIRKDRALTHIINTEQDIPKSFEITLTQFTNRLELPSQYYKNRGFSSGVLNEYAVGTCLDKSKPMYGRAIIPIHSLDGDKIIACSGRSIWEKCQYCKSHHNPKGVCPSKEYIGMYSKWRHSANLPSEYILYNYHKAIDSINKSGLVFLVEGFPNVWRLKEAGFSNVVAVMGTKFSYSQKNLLDKLALSTLVIIPDADEPSKIFIEAVKEICENSYNIHVVEPEYEDDIGECPPTEVQRILTSWR